MSKKNSAQYMSHLSAGFSTKALWLPLVVRYTLLRAPVDLRRSCVSQWTIAESTSRFRQELKEDRATHNDLFPLPLQLSAEDLRWDALACDPLQLCDCPESAIKSAWKHCMIMVLITPMRSLSCSLVTYELCPSSASGTTLAWTETWWWWWWWWWKL